MSAHPLFESRTRPKGGVWSAWTYDTPCNSIRDLLSNDGHAFPWRSMLTVHHTENSGLYECKTQWRVAQ